MTSFPSSSHRHCCKLAVCNCGIEQNMTRQVFPHVLASQQTTSWVPSGMVDLGYMYSVLHTALTSLFLSTSISNVTTPWEGCERCAAMLVSRAVVMSWYAPASDCDTALHESVVGEIRCGRLEAWEPNASSWWATSTWSCERLAWTAVDKHSCGWI